VAGPTSDPRVIQRTAIKGPIEEEPKGKEAKGNWDDDKETAIPQELTAEYIVGRGEVPEFLRK